MGDDAPDISQMQPQLQSVDMSDLQNMPVPGMPAIQSAQSAMTPAQKMMLAKTLMGTQASQGGMAAPGANGSAQFYVPQSAASGLNSALAKGLGAYMMMNNGGQ